ncbi:MAG: transcriptional regulator [Rhodobiaceae bacterium]|nr:MAG: transcriptional regulator [Rhodobiaceae bacterium]
MTKTTPRPRGAGRRRAAIREIIKNHGPQDAASMAAELGVDPMAVRQHLYAMQEEGLVTFEEKAEGRGRPTKYWKLTRAADTYFPDAHGELAVSLLTEMGKVFGDEGLEKLLAGRTAQQLKDYKARLKGLTTLKGRVSALAALRTQEGYMAVCEPAAIGEGAYLLIENHCPVCSAAAACQGLCKYELELFQGALGKEVTVSRTDHILAGARRCAYTIIPKRTKAAR